MLFEIFITVAVVLLSFGGIMDNYTFNKELKNFKESMKDRDSGDDK